MVIRFIIAIAVIFIMSAKLVAATQGASALACERLISSLTTLSTALEQIAQERSVQPMANSIINKSNVLKRQAVTLLSQGHVELAQEKLQRASLGVNTAIAALLAGETITYLLNFEGPQDECEYEIRRTQGLLMLAKSLYIEKKKSINQLKRYKSAITQLQGAMELANNGHFVLAMSVLDKANRDLRRIISAVGVWVPV